MNINKFNNYIEKLNEAFDNPSKIKWVTNSDSELDGEFYIEEVKYIIECYNWSDNIWSYKFSRIEKEEKIMDLVEDTLRKMKVLSTIRIGMRYLIEYKKPSGLIINITDGSRGRDYLWGRFSKEISEEFNYELTNKKIMGYSTYFLWGNIPFNIVNKAFNKMLKSFQNQ